MQLDEFRKITEVNRRTGRTTHMLRHVIESVALAVDDLHDPSPHRYAVLVVFADYAQAKAAKAAATSLDGFDAVKDYIVFAGVGKCKFNYVGELCETKAADLVRPVAAAVKLDYDEVYVDHSVYEAAAATLFAKSHRWLP